MNSTHNALTHKSNENYFFFFSEIVRYSYTKAFMGTGIHWGAW